MVSKNIFNVCIGGREKNKAKYSTFVFVLYNKAFKNVLKIFRVCVGGREENKIWISCMDNLTVSYRIINCQTSCQINNLFINLILELILETNGYTLVGEM